MLINTSGMRQLNALCWIFHHIGLKMDGVIVVYYDGDVVSTFEGVLFECPNDPKYIKISEEMLLVFLGKQLQLPWRWKKLISECNNPKCPNMKH